jgi:predicted dehydrogenase
MSGYSDPVVSIAILGAGSRGAGYAQLATESGRAKVVAVAEPDPVRRRRVALQYGLEPSHCFESYQQFIAQPRMADAVIIATVDKQHREPAVACARLGYDILLEKPMAPTEADALAILEAAESSGSMLMICHVLRHTRYTSEIRRLIAEGAIGEIASIEHLEPIGWWHFAHSYVRGNWGKESESSSMLLAKCSHDLDWLSFIVGKPAERISSFGSLMEFRPERKPPSATSRCVSCPVERECVYSAVRIYERFLDDPSYQRWPLGVFLEHPSAEALHHALRDGPYGRCVYDGYNDVVDHQVVNIEYAGGATASLTAVAFVELGFRKTRIFGTRGSIEGDGITLHVHDFLTDTKYTVQAGQAVGSSAADGHGGADSQLVKSFLDAVTEPRSQGEELPARESFRTHQIVWAAERARQSGTVVTLTPVTD